MPPPRLHINGPYMGSFLSQPPSAALKRSRAASAPCENEEARQRKRSRADTVITFMNENIPEEVGSEEGRDINITTPRSKGKQKESQPSDTHKVFGGVTAAVIEELAQVCTTFFVRYVFQHSPSYLFKELKCGCCTELCYNVRLPPNRRLH